MTRSERRAAEHAARKAARKAGFPQTEPSTISDAQLAANRLNAQKSTGPASSEAKAKVGRNAITHNLTGNQMIIRSEDVDRYETLIADYHAQFQPVGPEETYLLQSIVDIRWRLASIPAYEAALLDLGCSEMILAEPGMANNPRPVLEMQIRSHLEKKFRNLALQEARLARRREREMKELREMQTARQAREEEPAKAQAAPAPPQNGIAFTNAQIGPFLATLTPELRENLIDALLREDLPATETQEAAA